MRRNRNDDDYQPEMPPVEIAGHLIGYLFEVGPAMPAGMGQTSVSHQEMAAWQSLTGIRLRPWEARMLRRLSAEYCSEAGKAEKADCPAPFMPESNSNRADVAKDMRAALAGLAKL